LSIVLYLRELAVLVLDFENKLSGMFDKTMHKQWADWKMGSTGGRGVKTRVKMDGEG